MEKMWFVLSNGEISGPLLTGDVTSSMQAGRFNPGNLIWWKGSPEWKKLSFWQTELPAIIDTLESLQLQPQWYLFNDRVQTGPYERHDFFAVLKSLKDLKNLRVWNSTLVDWTNPYEMPELLTQIGIHARLYVREYIVGNAVIITGAGQRISLPLLNISEGGFSVTNAPELRLGDRVHFTIQSPFLSMSIRSIARVVSQPADHNAGLSFQSLNMELKSIILDYIRRQHGSILPDLIAETKMSTPRAVYFPGF